MLTKPLPSSQGPHPSTSGKGPSPIDTTRPVKAKKAVPQIPGANVFQEDRSPLPTINEESSDDDDDDDLSDREDPPTPGPRPDLSVLTPQRQLEGLNTSLVNAVMKRTVRNFKVRREVNELWFQVGRKPTKYIKLGKKYKKARLHYRAALSEMVACLDELKRIEKA